VNHEFPVYEWNVTLESDGKPVGVVTVEAQHYLRAGSLAKDFALMHHSVSGFRLEVVKMERGRELPRSKEAPAATSCQPQGAMPQHEADATPAHLMRQGYRSGRSN
jgi:hypothetical protein